MDEVELAGYLERIRESLEELDAIASLMEQNDDELTDNVIAVSVELHETVAEIEEVITHD